MPSLTAILYCFRDIKEYASILKKINVYQDEKCVPRFDHLVLCLAPVIDNISWAQWINAAFELNNVQFRKALESYEMSGESSTEGTYKPVTIEVVKELITGRTAAEWAWALGANVEYIKYFAAMHNYDLISEIIDDSDYLEIDMNRAFVRLGLPIPFPTIKK